MIARLVVSVSLAATALVATACKDDGGGASCGKVVDHTIKLAGLDAPSADQRKEMIAQCEKQPAKTRECALKAKDLEGLMACK